MSIGSFFEELNKLSPQLVKSEKQDGEACIKKDDGETGAKKGDKETKAKKDERETRVEGAEEAGEES